MVRIVRSILGIVLLVGVVYFIVNYSGAAKETVGVKGVSTQIKADDITQNINNDINKEIQTAANKAGEVKVSDIVNTIARFQRIPQDISSISAYLQEQVKSVTTKK